MSRTVMRERLSPYLRKVERAFPELSAPAAVTRADVAGYYNRSFWGYAAFHSWGGAIHMALGDGSFKPGDFRAQAQELLELLREPGSGGRVCELGCGRGFNLGVLAETLPQIEFVGVDLSERNLAAARRRFGKLSNLHFIAEDFHSLSSLQDRRFDLVFAVESLCHSDDQGRVFHALADLIAAGGKLVVYDGVRSDEPPASEELARAARYVEYAMAVPGFPAQAEMTSAARAAGFELEDVKDRSDEIMPTLMRLNKLARAYFKLPPLTRLINGLLPRELVRNAVAGLLMPITVQAGAHRYLRMQLVRR